MRLSKLLSAADPVAAIALMAQSGVLALVLPGADAPALGPAIAAESAVGEPPDWVRRPVGTARRVQVKRDTLVERITEFDPPRVLAYDIEGLPRLFRRVTNRWTLAPTGGEQTRVTLTSTVEIGPHATQKLTERALCRLVARQSDSMLAGLANRLEKARV